MIFFPQRRRSNSSQRNRSVWTIPFSWIPLYFFHEPALSYNTRKKKVVFRISWKKHSLSLCLCLSLSLALKNMMDVLPHPFTLLILLDLAFLFRPLAFISLFSFLTLESFLLPVVSASSSPFATSVTHSNTSS